MKDWRGTEINVGDLVIYSAGSGHGTQMVEAKVTGFGKGNNVKLHIIRSSSSVHILNTQRPANRITIVGALAVSANPVREDEVNKAKEAKALIKKNLETHTRVESYAQPKYVPFSSPDYSAYMKAYRAWTKVDAESKYGDCLVCGQNWVYQERNECK